MVPQTDGPELRYSPQATRLLDELQYHFRGVLREIAVELAKRKQPTVVSTEEIRAAVQLVGERTVSDVLACPPNGSEQNAYRSNVA